MLIIKRATILSSSLKTPKVFEGSSHFEVELELSKKDHAKVIDELASLERAATNGQLPAYPVLKERKKRDKATGSLVVDPDTVKIRVKSKKMFLVVDSDDEQLSGEDLVLSFGTKVTIKLETKPYDVNGNKGISLKPIELKVLERPSQRSSSARTVSTRTTDNAFLDE
jgi:hypothetical protein